MDPTLSMSQPPGAARAPTAPRVTAAPLRGRSAGRGRNWRPPVTTEKYDTRLLLTRLRREQRRGRAAVLVGVALAILAVAGLLELRGGGGERETPRGGASTVIEGAW